MAEPTACLRCMEQMSASWRPACRRCGFDNRDIPEDCYRRGDFLRLLAVDRRMRILSEPAPVCESDYFYSPAPDMQDIPRYIPMRNPVYLTGERIRRTRFGSRYIAKDTELDARRTIKEYEPAPLARCDRDTMRFECASGKDYHRFAQAVSDTLKEGGELVHRAPWGVLMERVRDAFR